MKEYLKNYLSIIKNHFKLANQGKEDLVIILWVWGGLAYLAAFFINKLILIIKFSFIKWIIAILVAAYFVWHIITIKKCTPKKPPLSDEEKAALKKDRFKRITRKIFLREPITKWNPSLVAGAIDLYIIIYFLEYLMK